MTGTSFHRTGFHSADRSPRCRRQYQVARHRLRGTTKSHARGKIAQIAVGGYSCLEPMSIAQPSRATAPAQQAYHVRSRSNPRLRSLLRGRAIFNNRSSILDCTVQDITPMGAKLRIRQSGWNTRRVRSRDSSEEPHTSCAGGLAARQHVRRQVHRVIRGRIRFTRSATGNLRLFNINSAPTMPWRPQP